MLGFTIAFGGIGALIGALLVERLTRRFGLGPTIIGALFVDALGALLIWMAGGLPILAVPLMIVAQLVGDMAGSIAMINQVSLRQIIIPDRLLGRVNAFEGLSKNPLIRYIGQYACVLRVVAGQLRNTEYGIIE
jgi:MFS family permease